jgi:50S ribosomal protein L16 3-hydroxylase
MIHFGKISQQEFLRDYWQKKPLLIKQALPDFISPLSPDELILLRESIKNVVINL